MRAMTRNVLALLLALCVALGAMLLLYVIVGGTAAARGSEVVSYAGAALPGFAAGAVIGRLSAAQNPLWWALGFGVLFATLYAVSSSVLLFGWGAFVQAFVNSLGWIGTMSASCVIGAFWTKRLKRNVRAVDA